MSTTVQVLRLNDHFPDVLRAVSGPGVKKAVLAGAYVIEKFAKANAVRGRPGLIRRTGILVGSISTWIERATDTMAEADVGPVDVVYARIHELGGIAGHGAHIPARPYLRPAVDEHVDAIVNAVGAEVKADIEGATR